MVLTKHTVTHKRTLWSPYKSNSQKVLHVVEQNVFDLEVLLHPDRAGAAGRHDKPWPVQADTGQPGAFKRG